MQLTAIETRPSNQCEFYIYLHLKSFMVATVVQLVGVVSWSGWSGGLGGPSGSGGPGGLCCQRGPGG